MASPQNDYPYKYGFAGRFQALHGLRNPRVMMARHQIGNGTSFDSQLRGKKSLGTHEPQRRRRGRNQYRGSPFVAPILTGQSVSDISLPGFGRLFTSSYPTLCRIVWGLAITTCFVVCTLQIAYRISEYLEVPFTVQIDVVRNDTLTFPALTICPFKPMLWSIRFFKMRRQYASLFNISYAYSENLRNKVPHFDLLKMPGVDTTYLWNQSGFGSVDAKEICRYSSMYSCPSKQEMISENLATYFGLCTTHSFDRDAEFESSHTGYDIVLKDYENFPNCPTSWTTQIIVHEKEDSAQHKVAYRKGLSVKPNTETILVISTKQYRRLNVPANPCQDQFDVTKCYNQCIEENIRARVDCRLPYFKYSGRPSCTDSHSAKATDGVVLRVYKSWIRGLLCPYCPRSCFENLYTVMQDVVEIGINDTKIKLVLLDNTVDVITETPSLPLNVLVSDIGGNLGFFLGACILTGLEILECIIFRLQNWFIGLSN